MRTVAFIARKGGVSKTTLAAHVAVRLAAHQPVTLVDADPQGSLTHWWHDREADTPALMAVPVGSLRGELAKASEAEGVVIIDTPAFDSGITATVIQVSDLVVIPVNPSPHDFRAVAVTVEAAQKAGKPILFIITRAVGGAALTAQARAVLSQTGPVAKTVMHNRVSYAGAMTDGRTVQEMEPSGRAAGEITLIADEIMLSLSHAVKKPNRRASNGR